MADAGADDESAVDSAVDAAYEALYAEGMALHRYISTLPSGETLVHAQMISAQACLSALLLHAVGLRRRRSDAYLMPQTALLIDALRLLQTALLHSPTAGLHYELYWRGVCVDARAAAYMRALGAAPCACADADTCAPRASNADLLIAYARLAEITGQPFDALFERLVSEGTPIEVDALAGPFEAAAHERLPALAPTERQMAIGLLDALEQMRRSPRA